MDVVTRQSVSLDLARRLVDAAVDLAGKAGKPFVAAVVDESGVLKSFARMDGSRLSSVKVAIDKAYTAVSGRPTHLWHERLAGDPVLAAGARDAMERLVTLGGGYPIVVDGVTVGGFGVAGGHYSEDMEVATGALASVGVRSEW